MIRIVSRRWRRAHTHRPGVYYSMSYFVESTLSYFPELHYDRPTVGSLECILFSGSDEACHARGARTIDSILGGEIGLSASDQINPLI